MLFQINCCCMLICIWFYIFTLKYTDTTAKLCNVTCFYVFSSHVTSWCALPRVTLFLLLSITSFPLIKLFLSNRWRTHHRTPGFLFFCFFFNLGFENFNSICQACVARHLLSESFALSYCHFIVYESASCALKSDPLISETHYH